MKHFLRIGAFALLLGASAVQAGEVPDGTGCSRYATDIYDTTMKNLLGLNQSLEYALAQARANMNAAFDKCRAERGKDGDKDPTLRSQHIFW